MQVDEVSRVRAVGFAAVGWSSEWAGKNSDKVKGVKVTLSPSLPSAGEFLESWSPLGFCLCQSGEIPGNLSHTRNPSTKINSSLVLTDQTNVRIPKNPFSALEDSSPNLLSHCILTTCLLTISLLCLAVASLRTIFYSSKTHSTKPSTQ